jgi:dethiobiotin synthetase
MFPMTRKQAAGLFVTGTDTGVGKTYVAALIALALRASGHRVGVYKPAASGCRRVRGKAVSDDAVALWEAAGRPGPLDRVCPQRFLAPLAPHLAAREEGKRLDPERLRRGLEYWRRRSDIVLVEGAGGLMSPLGDDEYVADLAYEFRFPLLVVARNALGAINQTLQTLIAAATFRDGLEVAGIVLNHPAPPGDDASAATNRAELIARCVPPVLAEVAWNAAGFDSAVDWAALASPRNQRTLDGWT